MKKSESIAQREAPPKIGVARREAILTVIRRAVPKLEAVYLFGSQVTGRVHRESDIDVAILAGAPISPEVRLEVLEDLSVQLRSDVDLVDLRSASTVMQTQVVSTGAVLFEREAAVRHRFEMQTLSAYALLNEERAAILEQVHRRGRIYGR